jgi:hypothetical protein
MVMFTFILLAAYYVEQTVSTRADELAAMPIDEEVKRADEAGLALKAAYQEVTQWKDIPAVAQVTLIISLACMITSCYMVQLFQNDAFAEFQLTYTIENHLDGDWKNLVKPIGWVAIILFVGSILFLTLFKCWANGKAQKLLKSRPKTVEDDVQATVEDDAQATVEDDAQASKLDTYLDLNVQESADEIEITPTKSSSVADRIICNAC